MAEDDGPQIPTLADEDEGSEGMEPAPEEQETSPAPAAGSGGPDWEERANDLTKQVLELKEDLSKVKKNLEDEEKETARLQTELAERDERIDALEGERDVDLGELTDDLRRDLDSQQEELEQMREDLREKEEEIRREQEATQRAQDDLVRERENASRFQKDTARDKAEIERLQAKISDQRREMEKVKREQFKSRKANEERLKKTNAMLDQNEELMRRDKELQDAADEAQAQLQEVVAELEEVSAELDDSKATIKRISIEMSTLEAKEADFDNKLAEAEDNLQAQEEDTDRMAEEFEARIAELSDAYEETKEQLDVSTADVDRLQSEIDKLKDESALGNMQTRVEELEKVESDLSQANAEMEAELGELSEERDELKSELKELKRDAKKILDDAVGAERVKTAEAMAELAEETQARALLQKRYDVLDDTVAEKDSEIFRIQTRMDEMEQSVWGLPEAVKEVKLLTSRVAARDKELKSAKQDLNDRVRQLDALRLETTELRRRLGKFTDNAGEDDEGQAAPLFDLKVLKLKEQAEMERLRALNEILTTENEQLEEERVDLKFKLRFSASQRAQFALSMGLTAEQYSFLEQIAERMREDGVPDMPLNDRSRELEEQLQRRDDQISELREKLAASDDYGDEVKDSLEQMRNVIEGLFKENRELRSANIEFQPHASVSVGKSNTAQDAVEHQHSAVVDKPEATLVQQTPEKAAQPVQSAKAGKTTQAVAVSSGSSQHTSAPGTPLQRQVLRILADSGLRSSLTSRQSPADTEENQRLREANARLLENALESSASADSGVLKERAVHAEAEVASLQEQVTKLKDALRRADLGVPWVPPMPSEAMQKAKTSATIKEAQSLATPRRDNAHAPTTLVDSTSVGMSQDANAANKTELAYSNDYVDLQTQLIEVLAENEQLEKQLHDMQRVMSGHRQELATAVDRQALLYREHIRCNKDWKNRMREQEKHIQQMDVDKDAMKLQLERYSNLESLVEEAKAGLVDGSDIVSRLKAQVLEMTRKATVLEVEEMLARRKSEFMEQAEALARRQYDDLRADQTTMESTLRLKIVNLEQARMEFESKLAEAHAEAKTSVPKEYMDKLRSDHGSLMRRHQDLVLAHSNSSTQMLELKSLRTEVLALRTELDTATNDLQIEKLKSKKAENLARELETNSQLGDSALDSIELRRKLDTADMQRKSFETRAANAERRAAAHQKAEESQTERVSQLENERSELVEKLRIERDECDKLRREAESSITVEQSQDLQVRLTKAETLITKLKVERDKYKEVAAIAAKQANTIQHFTRRDSEVADGLRRAVVDLQAESDDKNSIAKLHMQLIDARLVDMRTNEKAFDEKQQLQILSAKVFDLEEEADMLRSKLLRAHADNTKRERSLERRLWETRDALAGSVKMEQQEKTIALAHRLQASNAELEATNKKICERALELEVQLQQSEISIEQEKELKKLESTSIGDEKDKALREMSEKVLKLRVAETRLQRMLRNVAEQEQYYSRQAHDLEAKLREVEERSIKAEVQAQHNTEMLEQEILTLKGELNRATEDNRMLKRKAGSTVNADKQPVTVMSPRRARATEKAAAAQIDSSSQSDREMVLALRGQVAELNRENSDLSNELAEMVVSVSTRDTRIEALEMQIRDSRAGRVTARHSDENDIDARATEEAELQRNAQEIIARLQGERTRKDEEIARMQDMMRDVRQRAVEERGQLEQEISKLTDKLFTAKSDDVNKLRSAMQKLERGEVVTQVYYDQQTGATNWMKQAREWEETLSEKDAIADELKRQLQTADLEIEKHKAATAAKDEECKRLSTEVEELRHRKPSDKLKKLVKTLKQQLAAKEKQLRNLQQAIETLRADVEASGVQSTAQTASENDEQLRTLLEKQTKFVQRLKAARAEISQCKDREVKYKAELDVCRPAAQALQNERSRADKLEAELMRLKRSAKAEPKTAVTDATCSSGPGAPDDVAELKLQLDATLQEKVELEKQLAKCKALSPSTVNPSNNSGQSIAQWEADKKQRAKIERMTAKLLERKKEIERLNATCDESRLKVGALERDKDKLIATVADLEKAVAAASAALGPSDDDLAKITASETSKQKILQLESETQRLNKVINVDNAQHIARLERQIKDLREQNAVMETMMKHHANQLEQAAAKSGVDREWIERTNSDLREAIIGSKEEVQNLRNQLLKMENDALESRFETEDAKHQASKLQTRVDELQALSEYLRRNAVRGMPVGNRKSSRKQEREIELEAVIDGLQRTVEKLNSENDHLRKIGTTASKYQDLRKKRKELERRKKELEEANVALTDKLAKAEDQAKKVEQTSATVQGVRKTLKKAETEKNRARKHAASLQAEVDEANSRASEAEAALSRVQRGTDSALSQLRAQNEELEKSAAEREQAVATLSAQLQEAQQYQEELRARLGTTSRKLTGSGDENVESAAPSGMQRDPEAHVTSNDESLGYAELAQLYDKERTARAALESEANAMREELAVLDPAFFEEVEDLKYDFDQAKARNEMYEKQLRQISEQTGVAWEPIP